MPELNEKTVEIELTFTKRVKVKADDWPVEYIDAQGDELIKQKALEKAQTSPWDYALAQPHRISDASFEDAEVIQILE